MNPRDKSKQCPRCRFQLIKTHSQKLICKRCGYTSNKLQIVSEQDVFNTNIKFSRRVTMRKEVVVPDHEMMENRTENLLQIYLKHYQSILRHLGTTFINQHINKSSLEQRQKATATFKQLWFAYLQKMTFQGNVVCGSFIKVAEKADKKRGDKVKEEVKKTKEEKEEESEDDGESEEEGKDGESGGDGEKVKGLKEEAGDGEGSGSGRRRKGKRGRQENQDQAKSQQQQDHSNKPKRTSTNHYPKDPSLTQFKRLVNSTLKHLKLQKSPHPSTFTSIITLHLLTPLLSLPLVQPSFHSICYLAQKYTWLLVSGKLYAQINNNKSKRRNGHNKAIQKKLSNKYVSQDDLRELCRERGLMYEKRRVASEVMVLAYGVLEGWYNQTFSKPSSSLQSSSYPLSPNHSPQPLPYPYLLQTYLHTPTTKPAILTTLTLTLQRLSESQTIKQQSRQNQVPQLCLKFICSLLYLTTTINGHTITILQIINFTIKELQRYAEQHVTSELVERKEVLACMLRERNVNVRRVKKICCKVAAFVGIVEARLEVKAWCERFGKEFMMPDETVKEWVVLAETLVGCHLQQAHPHPSSSSFSSSSSPSPSLPFLQQPQLTLATLTIYLKLRFGLDRNQYAYLKNIGEVWGFIEENKEWFVKQKQKEKIGVLEGLVRREKDVFGGWGKGEGLVSTLSSITQSFHPLLSLHPSLSTISHLPPGHLPHSLIACSKLATTLLSPTPTKHRNVLTLVYNFNQLMLMTQEEKQQQTVHVNVVGDQKRQERRCELFKGLRLERRVGLREEAARALDYLCERWKRWEDKNNDNTKKKERKYNKKENKKENDKRKEGNTNRKEQEKDKQQSEKNQADNRGVIMIDQEKDNDNDKINNNNNNSNKQINSTNNNNTEINPNNPNNPIDIIPQPSSPSHPHPHPSPFPSISSLIDHPSTHYQLIYRPTINTLTQLHYHQLLVLVQSLSLVLCGQYSDCRDILEWVGELEAGLKMFEGEGREGNREESDREEEGDDNGEEDREQEDE